MRKADIIDLIEDPIRVADEIRRKRRMSVGEMLEETGIKVSTYYATSSGRTKELGWGKIQALMLWAMKEED